MTLHYQVPLAAVKGLFTLNLQCLRLHFLTIVSITVENSNVDIESLRLRFSKKKKLEATRMHSSGMRTICSSGGGVSASVHAGIPAPRPGAPREQTPLRPGTPSKTSPAMHAGIAHPPGDLLQGMLGYHLKGMLGYHPPVDRHTPVKT